MIYIIPTKRGMGVEIWGTYHDLSNFYDVIAKFWNDEQYMHKSSFENRDKVISRFSYEIRKAKEGSRLIKKANHLSSDKMDYFGCQISWVHFLFALTAIKFNMRFYETNKFDIAQILLIEYSLEKAMKTYDANTAEKLIGFIEDGLYGANKCLYQYMRSIYLDYYLLGGGKTAFKKLPDLLLKGVYYTNEYREYQIFLQEEAKRLSCEITDLEINDEDIDYEKHEW